MQPKNTVAAGRSGYAFSRYLRGEVTSPRPRPLWQDPRFWLAVALFGSLVSLVSMMGLWIYSYLTLPLWIGH